MSIPSSKMSVNSSIQNADSIEEQILSVVLLAVISLFGFVLNGLLVTAITASKHLRTSAGAIVVIISTYDLVMCSVFYPFHAYGCFNMEWNLPRSTCVATAIAIPLCTFQRIFAFPFIAWNRYVFVTKTRAEYLKLFTVKRTALMVIVSFSLPVFLICMPFLTKQMELTIKFSQVYDVCIIHNTVPYIPITEFAVCVACFIGTVTFYALLLKHVHVHVRDTQSTLQQSFPGPSSRTRNFSVNVIRMMAAVSGGFCLCVLPYLILRVADPALISITPVGHKVSLLILSLSSLVTPLAYIVTNALHRSAIKSLLKLQLPDIRVKQTPTVASLS